jgi:hypothetical protein
MRKLSELFQVTVGTITAMLALATFIMMPGRAQADPACMAAGEGYGQECAPLGGSCANCVYAFCGEYAQGDGSCYTYCHTAGTAFCS